MSRHQWNFDAVDDGFLLCNEVAEVDVGSALAGRAVTTAGLENNEVVARLAVGRAA